jgi:hypothetical protein
MDRSGRWRVMRSSTSGFLLLLLGALGLIGFLTGNLDRWLGYLFSAGSTPIVSVAPKGVGEIQKAPASTGDRRTGQVG